ncbi:hypothetical protein AURDEDRAFT_84583 [Auricularia subglabra TFB-10046 SS5]|nr:hypothetical protein AURDEDRAFT_84583 [Auricularia subglabra TFB-10046 SS5]
MAAAASSSSQTALDNATRSSTASWQADLKVLFDNAKDRFADVVWEFQPDSRRPPEEVWGHKAIVYARAPPAFQQRYFAFRPAPVASPVPYSTSPMPQNFGPISSVSLGIDLASPSRSPSPYDDPRATSPTPSTAPGPLLRLQPQIDPTLFSNELEYLYTGKGFGEAFEFLFDSANGGSADAVQQDAEQLRVEKLRHDLNYMWRSRLYSDVRISLTGNFSSTPSNADASTAIFSSHRFVLMSRSPYFRAQLSGGFAQPPSATPGGPITLSLPSPPFTPASLHFALGYIYTGTLVFSHRTYDLDTAFAIMRSAAYLQLPQLHNEVEARIVEEMMHGLCLPYIPFAQYEQLTGGKWAAAGCKCRQCARRAPRVLAFAMEPDVRNAVLENGARRTLSGLFGDGWCTPEFAALQPRVRSSLLSGLAKRTTPSNLFNLLAATQAAFKRLDKEQTDIAKRRDGTKKVIDPKELDESWIATVREAIISARKVMDECLCAHAEEAFEMDDWLVLLEGDGVGFNDKDRVEGVMASLVRGLTDKNAGHVYQTLVECVLLRQHPTDANASLLSASSPIRSIVESTRAEIIKWLSKHWAGVQQAAGFDGLASWALKEIADELEVPAEDLLSPGPGPARGPATRTGLRPIMPRSGVDQDQQDTASMTSLRASVLGKQFAATPTSSSGTERGEAASLRSSPTSPARVTPKQTVAARRPAAPVTPETARTRSLAASVDGGASTRAGVRKVSPSNTSTTSVASSAYRTAGSTAPPRTRTTSMASKQSTSTANNLLAPPGPSPRQRRSSTASVSSVASARSAVSTTSRVSVTPSVAAKKPVARGAPTPTPATLAPRQRTISAASAASRTPSVASKVVPKTPKRELVALPREAPKPPVPATPKTEPAPAPKSRPVSSAAKSRPASSAAKSRPTSAVKKPDEDIIMVDDTPASRTSVSTIRRKGSSDTITEANALTIRPANRPAPSPPQVQHTFSQPPAPQPVLPEQLLAPQGITLNVGIPCIISSKRTRFRAYARYIGEVAGELGPWVGVEVPVGGSWGGERLEGRAWHDGSWGGVRYFDVGASTEWEVQPRGTKREGDSLSVAGDPKRLRSASPAMSDVSASAGESRGLFVRPQQVLYVVDAEQD